MNRFDLSKLPEFLNAQRWFGGKGMPIKNVEVIDHANLLPDGSPAGAGEGCLLAVVEVIYELGHPERYLIPVVPGEDGGVREALEDDELARGLLRIVREQSAVPTGSGTLRGELVNDGGAISAVSPRPQVRRIAVEQSNTSIVFDDRVIMKVIRKLDLGTNPEWEMGRFLQTRGFLATPPLLGGITLDGAAHSTLAVVHEFVKVDNDGWAWLLEELRRQPEPSAGLLAQIRTLGEQLGHLHTVLASDTEDPAFAPEPVGIEDLQRWSSSIIGELGVTIAAAMDKVPELAERRDEFVERIGKLAHAEPSGMKIRLHGDLHLGQTLRSGGRWLLFDFEGEPARGYAQRREKHSPLRDVAGMLRSFAYAAASLELEGAPEANRLDPLRDAFLEGYRTCADRALLPQNEQAFRCVLDTLELEKLLYELRYEVTHRPGWVRIPARALLSSEAR
jgi:maltokinase